MPPNNRAVCGYGCTYREQHKWVWELRRPARIGAKYRQPTTPSLNQQTACLKLEQLSVPAPFSTFHDGAGKQKDCRSIGEVLAELREAESTKLWTTTTTNWLPSTTTFLQHQLFLARVLGSALSDVSCRKAADENPLGETRILRRRYKGSLMADVFDQASGFWRH